MVSVRAGEDRWRWQVTASLLNEHIYDLVLVRINQPDQRSAALSGNLQTISGEKEDRGVRACWGRGWGVVVVGGRLKVSSKQKMARKTPWIPSIKSHHVPHLSHFVPTVFTSSPLTPPHGCDNERGLLQLFCDSLPDVWRSLQFIHTATHAQTRERTHTLAWADPQCQRCF